MLMQPDLPDGFFSMPWPNDIRHKGERNARLTGFRVPPATRRCPRCCRSAAREHEGVRAERGDLPARVGSARSHVAADDGGEHEHGVEHSAGEPRHARRRSGAAAGGLQQVRDDVSSGESALGASLSGHPLAEGARYALIVLDGVRDVARAPAGAAAAARRSRPAVGQRQAGRQDQVGGASGAARGRPRVRRAAHRVVADQVVAFSVFTPRRRRPRWMRSPPRSRLFRRPRRRRAAPGDCSAPGAQRTTVTGLIGLPKWQSGTYPYASSGGRIVVKRGQGRAAGHQQVGFAMTFPCGAAPVSGWPLLLFMGDAGSSAQSDPIPGSAPRRCRSSSSRSRRSTAAIVPSPAAIPSCCSSTSRTRSPVARTSCSRPRT